MTAKQVEQAKAPPMATSLDAARQYQAAGWQAVPLLPRTKRPFDEGGPERDYGAEGLEQHFQGDGNIGLKCGAPSGGLVDVDIDDEQALRIAAMFLPATGMRHG